MSNEKAAKSAIVTIIGRPSSGKSTFLNTAAGEKVSIVSPVPQTTRNSIRGIINTSYGQLVFIDTPGYHNSEKKFNNQLKSIAEENIADSDLVLYLIDSTRIPGEEETLVVQLVKPFLDKTVIGINKIDLPESNQQKIKDFLTQVFPDFPQERIVSVSAANDTNINDLLLQLYKLAPEQPAFYPEEYYTDQEVDFRISEIIRENAMNLLHDELPHAIYVEIADMEWRNENKKLWVRAFIVVERDSQKGIVIGKSATMIKTIRIESIKQLRKIFDYKIELDLQVKVNKNWRQKDNVLAKLLQKSDN